MNPDTLKIMEKGESYDKNTEIYKMINKDVKKQIRQELTTRIQVKI